MAGDVLYPEPDSEPSAGDRGPAPVRDPIRPWRKNVLVVVLVMAGVIVAGIWKDYEISDIALGVSLIGNIGQAIINLEKDR